MWYWKDTQAVLRCVHVPKFHDPNAQIPEHETESWHERVDQPPFP